MRRYIMIAARGILFAAIIFWMMTIFGFSAADAEESVSTSDIITKRVIQLCVKDYDSYKVVRQQEIWNNTSFFVRKVGHFGEYAILSVLIFMFMITFEEVRRRYILLIINAALCMLYAVTDEVHQGFVAGRAPRVMDVLIDSFGSIAGILFALTGWHFVIRKIIIRVCSKI